MPRKDKKINRKKHEVNSNTIAIISSIVILLGYFIFSYHYTKAKKIIAYEYMNNIFYEKEAKKEKQKSVTEKEELTEELPEEEKQEEKTYNYLGYLEIPKIKLKKGFVSKKSRDNNVEKNIFIVDQSDYPDKEGGNFIIAAHSGSGWKAFFNNLYQLQREDQINVTYKNKKYIYKIADIYTQKKTGSIAIYRDYSKTTITLVTCTNNDDKTQTVYIAYLEQIEN